MSILFYFPDLRPGGAERVMLQLLHYMHANKYSVEVLLGKKEGELLEQLNPEIVVHELGHARARGAVLPLISFCKRNQPDILFSTLGAAAAVALAKPFLPKKTKLISRLGNTIGAEQLLYKNPVRRAIYLALNKHIAKQSDALVFQSNYMREDFSKFIKFEAAKGHVIYNPVSTQEIELKGREMADYSDLLAIGRLMEQKDYYTLIRSIACYKSMEGKPIRLSIIGSGHLEKELKALVNSLELNNEIKFLGFQRNPYKYLCKSKYLISSSLYEGFSNVILEALALGVPAIVTDCPSGNREIVKVEENGFFTEVGDPERMAKTIKKALESENIFNPDLIASNIKRKFDINRIGQQYLKLFSL